MKKATSTPPPAVEAAAEPLLINSLTFTPLVAERAGREAACMFSSTVKRKQPMVRFNIAMCAAHPGLLKLDRVQLFQAKGNSPALAVIPSVDGAKVTFNKGAARISSGALASLARTYRRVNYRVERIETPRPGWLLTPTASERHPA